MFGEKRNHQNQIVKASAKFGKYKEICITPFNGRTYVHLSDTKNCFQSDGSFDLSKSKSISFNLDEIKDLRMLISHVERYNSIFHEMKTQVTTPERSAFGTMAEIFSSPPRSQFSVGRDVNGVTSPSQPIVTTSPTVSLPPTVVIPSPSTSTQHVPPITQQVEVAGEWFQDGDEVFFAMPIKPSEN